MADNAIDLIVAKEAYAQLDKLITGLNEVDAKVADTVAKANAQFKNMGSITTPSMSGDNSAQMAELNQKIKELSETTKKYETQIKALSEAKKTYSRTVSQESVDTTIANKNAREAFQATSKLISEYDKLDLAHKKAMKSAQAIGAQYGSTSKEFLQASVNFKKLDDEIKAIDATLGKNNRNVGNYKSGFNGLSNSINQLTREAPAFANSIGTGFMALSNNIPILADEIANLKQKNLDLVKSGQPVQSMTSTLMGAFFSWQTALSVGVTLLTLYGAKLIEYAFNTDSAKKATDSLTKSMKDNADQVKENIKELENQADADVQLARKRGASEEELFKIKSRLGIATVSEYEKNHNDITARIDSFDKYTRLKEQDKGKALLFLANQYNGNITKARKEYLRRESAYTDANRKLLVDAQTKAYEELKQANNKNVINDLTFQADSAEDKLNNQKKYNEEANKLSEERLKAIYEANKAELELELYRIDSILENQNNYFSERSNALEKDKNKRLEIATLDYNEQIRLAKGNAYKEEEALSKLSLAKLVIDKKYNDSRKEILKEQTKEYQDTINELDKLLKEYHDKKTADEEAMGQADLAQQKAIQNKRKEDYDNHLKEMAKRLEITKSFIEEFFSKSGFSETFKLFDGEDSLFARMKDGMAFTKESWSADMVQMTEGVQEMYNFISNASQQNFDAEYARLESQKEIAIGFAGDSAVAKEKIEKDAEKRKKEIANRENKAKQKQAMFNIAIDTAQAIMAIWAHGVDPTGISQGLQTAIVGALGAVQIGMVASQKIPQYFDGTDNHTGGLMLVNDGKGANYKEKVVLPNGQVILPQDRNVLMEAPKGTKVLNHEQQLFEMLQGKGVSMSVAQSQGMTADEMDVILAKHFSGIKTHNTTIDKNGFNSYIRNGNSITRMNSNRSQGIGLSV